MLVDTGRAAAAAPRHEAWVRVAHWIVAATILVLGVTGVTILMAHPRLYWGETGNDLTPPLLELKISRNYKHGGWAGATPFFEGAGSPISASRTYDIFNQNGWARSLHFLAAWALVMPGLLYLVNGLAGGHFRAHILPLRNRGAAAGPQYGRMQKLAYSGVIFVAAPLMVLTGMTMAPAVTAAMPILLRVFGGYQSARTIHFVMFAMLALFTLAHVIMVIRSGFRRQMKGMILGR